MLAVTAEFWDAIVIAEPGTRVSPLTTKPPLLIAETSGLLTADEMALIVPALATLPTCPSRVVVEMVASVTVDSLLATTTAPVSSA